MFRISEAVQGPTRWLPDEFTNNRTYTELDNECNDTLSEHLLPQEPTKKVINSSLSYDKTSETTA